MIDDHHCDAKFPVLYLDDFTVVPDNRPETLVQSSSLMQLAKISPSRAQFHILKAHLCMIARKLLNTLYLSPKRGSNAVSEREKWDLVQVVMEDLHELGACIPTHLQVANIDDQENQTYQQQAVCLDLMINHVILLAYRPLTVFSQKTFIVDKEVGSEISLNVSSARQKTCREALYAAACGICSMIVEGRQEILSTTVQLILSAWGIFTSAAELIAHYAISAPSGSSEARDAYANLSCLLRQFTCLRGSMKSAGQEYAILHDLLAKVRSKIQIESRMPSCEPVSHGDDTSGSQTSPPWAVVTQNV
ncbi:hypothetical protein LTR99_010401 [Exophiala xenobiotica]|nr:hypothetical protein LTR72_007752 [Exophiala xenobiotica]KAK5530264.1 hypothetical protein LTR23_010422 [Chaetothyriales sp. CCFEE 6169]KAK5264111.1 hypothetical protein LTR96_010619 [Exophiala xenobiotica]KAK5286009.1 hypothetical protein LTR14_010530 [Exophiala xenobiotica]KAK5292653.1 hypothetical protein LTR99_010401 [Exophiala xenobiotica]